MPSRALLALLLIVSACSASSCTGGGGQAGIDARAAGGDGASPGSDGGATTSEGWLRTQGNRIFLGGSVWHGRGANIHDTRSCNACSYSPPDPAEVERRLDVLIDEWGANFVRLNLESYAQAEGRQHWQPLSSDSAYLADVKRLVDYIGTKPGARVLLSMWVDPSFGDLGWPTTETAAGWRILAETFADSPHVLFGLVNEPEFNFDGALDAQVWESMNNTVAAIREVEAAAGDDRHIIAVQGTGGWARLLEYYRDNPITAGGGANIAYEVHVYNDATDFQSMINDNAEAMPIIIGEFGPYNDIMDEAECTQLMDIAEGLGVPYLAWTFHMRCPPNLLIDNSNGGCGTGMALEPSGWGLTFRSKMQSFATGD